VFKNRVLREIFVLNGFMISSPKAENQIKKIEMGDAYSARGRAVYKVMMVWEF
jgi:hypothetical protein